MNKNISVLNGVLAIISSTKKKYRLLKSMKIVIFLSFFLLTLGMIFIFKTILENSYHAKTVEQKIAQVQNQCNVLGNQILINQFSIESLKDNLSVEIDQLANVLEGRILIIDSTYKIIKDTYTINQNHYILYNEIFRIMRGETEKTIKREQDYAEIIMPIVTADKEIAGAMIVTVSLKDIYETNVYIGKQTDVLISMFVVIAILVAFMIAFISVQGIKSLNGSIEMMSAGHIDEISTSIYFSEIQELTDSFNVLIEKMQVLEDSRQEFVSNVSHELKTPITSMKVLADSLLMQEDVPAEMYREFMSDMVEEINRENQIINDLLTLVRTDRKSAELNIEPVNINALLELLLKRIKPLAAKRNIEVVYESFREVIGEIDEVKLSLALSNLIENAVKYNEDGGWIKVSLNADHKFFYIKVADSGVGIPEDCQEQVFERFYRVDKARARAMGGTGLGLAIVKEIMEEHGGTVHATSQLGEGTTMVLRFNKYSE